MRIVIVGLGETGKELAKEFNLRQKKYVKEVKEIPAFIKQYIKNIK